MHPLIHPSELLTFLQSEKDFALVDVRGMNKGKAAYLSGHIEGAVFIDLEQDLSDLSIPPEKGGRHPLPPLDTFYQKLESKGISSNSHIVIYDDAFGALGAARLWWMLKAIGHEKVQLLDGGLQKAIEMGLPIVQTDEPQRTPSKYEPKVKEWQMPLIQINALNKKIGQNDLEIIDVRGAKRYEGIEEPIDPKAGHIPTAINIPFSENLNQDGTFKSIEALKELYQNEASNRIIYCGSGVSACHTIFVHYLLKMTIPTLFVGSWSQWCRNS